MRNRKRVVVTCVVAFSLGAGGITHASVRPHITAPTTTTSATVVVGWGDKGADALTFTPKYIDIYVGDTVTWRDADGIDVHTVTFGPPMRCSSG